MKQDKRGSGREGWARLRFAVIGPLLASPPKRGELGVEVRRLASKVWKDPRTGGAVRFAPSTIERWYYRARKAKNDPMGGLAQKVRRDFGVQRSLSEELKRAIAEQYREHPSWSYQLHADNLAVVARKRAELGPMPSVSTVRRFMKAQGLVRLPRRGTKSSAGAQRAEQRFCELEVRGFEVEYVHGLWHLDFHEGSRRVLSSAGRYEKPLLLAILDDHSRLCCHAQWYRAETAESLVHGLSQAIQKRGMPRAIMWDNGAAMRSEEVLSGVEDLSIDPQPTLSYSPYQNGKQESFWTVVEGRLVAMLEGEKELSLGLLNEATAAWVELDYNRGHHSEIGTTPLKRFLEGREVGRESPSSPDLRRAFRRVARRRQRRSDGTISLGGGRFEVPSRFGHLEEILVRYARWDLSLVDMVDPNQRKRVLARLYPVDLAGNAEGRRRRRDRGQGGPGPLSPHVSTAQPAGIAPLLLQMMEEQRASGLPPAYLPTKDEERSSAAQGRGKTEGNAREETR